MRATAQRRRFHSWLSLRKEHDHSPRLCFSRVVLLFSSAARYFVYRKSYSACSRASSAQHSDASLWPSLYFLWPRRHHRPFSPSRLAVHSEGAGWKDGTAACTTRSRQLPPLQPRVPQSHWGTHRRGEHQEAQGGEEKAQRWEPAQAQRGPGGGKVAAPPVRGGSQRLGVDTAGGPGPLLQKSESGLGLRSPPERVAFSCECCSCFNLWLFFLTDFHSNKQRKFHLPLQRRSCLVPAESLQPSQKNIN